MDEHKYRLPRTAVVSMTAEQAEKLLSLRDGDCALLYLYVLARGGELNEDAASAVLGRTREQLRAAAAALRRAGLLTGGDEIPAAPAQELPEYEPEDIVERSRTDAAFRDLVSEAQRVLGHALSRADLGTLFGIYDRLGMSPDVIMLMLNHVGDQLRRRCGETRLPTMNAVQKEAFHWANREILTLPQAEEYVRRCESLERESEKLRRVLQIDGRAPTPTERKYMESWLDMGFGSEVLALAYDRTVTGTGRMAWAYMDKIVRSWHDKGLFTVEDVEKGDARPRKAGPAGAAGTAPRETPGGGDIDRLAELLNIKR